jgi:hypothetical protein
MTAVANARMYAVTPEAWAALFRMVAARSGWHGLIAA